MMLNDVFWRLWCLVALYDAVGFFHHGSNVIGRHALDFQLTTGSTWGICVHFLMFRAAPCRCFEKTCGVSTLLLIKSSGLRGNSTANQRFFRENHGDRVPNWATPATFSRAGWLPTVITCYHYWFPDFFYSLFMFYDYDNRIMACSNIIGS